MADRLARKRVPAEIAEQLLDRFEEVGLIDDEAFARQWVQSRQSSRGLARRALAQELRRRGIGDEVVREAIGEVDPESEEDAARRLVRRRLPGLAALDRDAVVRRLTGMLARKGYSAGMAFHVVRDELAAQGTIVDDSLEE